MYYMQINKNFVHGVGNQPRKDPEIELTTLNQDKRYIIVP
jgi:hypothetical protein